MHFSHRSKNTSMRYDLIKEMKKEGVDAADNRAGGKAGNRRTPQSDRR